MSEAAIVVEHVTKRFRIPLDRSTTLKYRVTHPRSSARYRELLVLDDLSFNVPAGEFLGITGPNGCGKSTLLKILSRIYSPDSGRVRTEGRLSPFLELGVGFNPELTARENIFLGGAVLGLTRRELTRRVESILDFAELTDFADAKLKNFSSGMAVRLAFTVAIQADAEILLMDEVLAVGDARFQEKCFDIFSEYKRQGRTIVLVSHDLDALNLYCDRVLLLQHGEVIADGPAADVTARYRRLVGAMSDVTEAAADPEAGASLNRWGSREVEITAVRLLDGNGVSHTSFATGEAMTVAVDYVVNADVKDFVFTLVFERSDGVSLSEPNSRVGNCRIDAAPPGSMGTVSYEMPKLELLGAAYQLNAVVQDEHMNHEFDHIEGAVTFRVADERGRHGMVDLQGRWRQSPRAPVAEPAAAPVSDRAAAGQA